MWLITYQHFLSNTIEYYRKALRWLRYRMENPRRNAFYSNLSFTSVLKSSMLFNLLLRLAIYIYIYVAMGNIIRIGNASFSRHKKSAGFDIIALPGETLQISIFAGTTSVANPLETTRSKTRHQTRPFLPLTRNVLACGRFIEVWGKKDKKSETTDGKNWKGRMESPRAADGGGKND